jgi:hypothetical protein
MLKFNRRVIVGGVVVAAFGLLIAARMPSGGADQSLEAANAVAAGINPVALMAIPRTNASAEDAALLGLEPDPASFDGAGLERWWSSYRQKHPTR